MDIVWSVGVSYEDVNGERQFVDYEVNADGMESASSLVRELFLMDYGVNSGVSFVAEPKRLSRADEETMRKVRYGEFMDLCSEFSRKTYKGFTDALQKFNGFQCVLNSDGDSWFCFDFLGLTVMAVFNREAGCRIDTRDIIYVDNFGRKMLARNNWSELYYAR